MKKAGLLLSIAMMVSIAKAQEIDPIGLEGDHLDLNGVLELFKNSESVEDFETKLNSEETGVNNLDLNEDGNVDYIRVVDHAEGDAHALALQVPINENEAQDVAVIEMDRVDEKTTTLQVIGDTELYGEEYILEPQDEKNNTLVVNVSSWRPVRHIYRPGYVVWVSPWKWKKHPRWYRPWRRVTWVTYHPRVRHYHRPCYRMIRVRRCHRAHAYYHKHHMHSTVFYNNHHHNHKSAVIKQNTGDSNHKAIANPSNKNPAAKQINSNQPRVRAPQSGKRPQQTNTNQVTGKQQKARTPQAGKRPQQSNGQKATGKPQRKTNPMNKNTEGSKNKGKTKSSVRKTSGKGKH